MARTVFMSNQEDWYPDKDSAARVPTWNYASAELPTWNPSARTRWPRWSARSASGSRPRSAGAWRFEPERDEQRRQLRGIVGFLPRRFPSW